ncbi:hypothetical protein D3C75_1272520 [compost metagenome]
MFAAVFNTCKSPNLNPQNIPVAGSFLLGSPHTISGVILHGLAGLGPAVATAATALFGATPSPIAFNMPQKKPLSG